ncbi:hypothetical protein [Saccharospirillum impatiens]|uniref:hypothetical protein n=1 Tax=Saccharospirillum impatiens TaxID=169438 RepID=UPI0003FDAA01|nr:hypothetical protein [Saccharospirillum impatiens]
MAFERSLTLPLLALVLTATLLYQLAGIESALWIAGAALIAFVAIRWPRLPRSPRILVGLALFSGLFLPWAENPWAVLRTAFDRAGYFSTFLIALSFLRLAAQRSRMVRRCGALAVNQPPGRRYGILSYTTALFGLILNFGVLHLLGLMVSRGNTLAAAQGNVSVMRTRQRRMSLAMLRGFAALPMTSPFSITLALLLTIIPGLRWQDILPIGFVTAALLILIGWIQDFRHNPRRLPPGMVANTSQTSWRPAFQLVSLIGLLTSAAFLLETQTNLSLTLSVILTSPLVGIGWLAWQGNRAGLKGATVLLGRRLKTDIPNQVAPLSGEVSLLAGAGFLGAIITGLVTESQVVWLVSLLHLDGYFLLIAAMILTVALGQVGFNPIVSVTLLASALQPVTAFGLTHELLALGLMSAWCLTVNSSPFTISVSIVGYLSQVSPRHLAWNWNRRYLLVSFLFLCVWLFGLQWLY